MSPSDALACLYVAFPVTLEEEVLDVAHDVEGLPGVTVVDASGYGAGARLHTVEETVRGRARRRLMVAVATHEVLDRLLVRLRTSLPTPDVAWWTVPVIAFGRLA